MLLFLRLFCLVYIAAAIQTLDVLLILDHPRLITVNCERSSVEVFVEICLEYKQRELNGRELTSHSEELLGIQMENVESSKSSKTLHLQRENVQTLRMRKNVIIRSDQSFDLTEYPNDEHEIQLKFTSSLKNSSELALNPHFAKVDVENMSNHEWRFEIVKSYVQWVVQKNESFEQAVFDMKITRKTPIFVSIVASLMYLTNILLIFDLFPVFSMDSIKNQSIVLFAVQVVSTLLAAQQAFGQFHRYILCQLLLSTIVCVAKYVSPFFLYHLRCCPIESDPQPPLFPSPSDQFSLDTERAKCHAAMDSARAESLRSPRAANFDMCMAEVKFTMANFNEVLNLHASSEWRRKLWRNAYRRFEITVFTLFQLINIILFITF